MGALEVERQVGGGGRTQKNAGYENQVSCMFTGKNFTFKDSLADPYNTKPCSIPHSHRRAEMRKRMTATPTFNLSRCGGRLDRLIMLRYSEA